jgi:S1-C subfamily serine protease
MLVRTNSLRGLVEADVGATPITDRWPEISTLLSQRCGEDVAALFAEPVISRSNGAADAVARWYCPFDGPVVSLAALDDSARAATAESVAALLSRLAPLFDDPAARPLIGPCLHIASPADIHLVGDRPVITNWGFLPADVAASPARREAHFRQTLGQFLPGVAVPDFSVQAASPPQPEPVVAAAAPPAQIEYRYLEDRRWLPLAIATGVAALVLLILLFGNVLLYPSAASSVVSADELELRQQINSSLEEHVGQLRRQLATMTCTPRNPTGAPGALPRPASPSSGSAAPPASPAVSPSPQPSSKEAAQTPPAAPESKPAQPPTGGSGAVNGKAPLSVADLLPLLENNTVFVIRLQPPKPGIATGSGFFVNARQIVTNRHVVAPVQPGDKIVVAGKALGKAMVVRLVAVGSKPGEDFAVLEVDEAVPGPEFTLATDLRKLQPVTAAGFTGQLIQDDEGMRKLLAGDRSAMPELITTQGVITVVQQRAGIPNVFHSATISHGNSGGPLVDACGRVVAVNTFGVRDSTEPIVFNGSLGSAALADFLEANHVSFTKTAEPCGDGEASHAAAPPSSPAPR